jgi:hypothetical protein
MNVAEILRALADKISSVEQEVPHQDQTAELTPVEVDHGEDKEVINTKSMVAPLQQKLDLMKRLAGEEEACEECGCAPCECDHAGHEDEMAIMKRNAGIAPVVIALADEDEPFEG